MSTKSGMPSPILILNTLLKQSLTHWCMLYKRVSHLLFQAVAACILLLEPYSKNVTYKTFKNVNVTLNVTLCNK